MPSKEKITRIVEEALKSDSVDKTINDRIKNHQMRLIVDKSDGLKNIDYRKTYKPTDVISDEDWSTMKGHYLREFEGLGIDIDTMEGYLDTSWEQWNAGIYPTIDKFVQQLDTQYTGYADLLKEKNKKSFLDVEGFDILNDKWGELANQLRWDDSTVDNILKEEVIEVETDITMYFKKRIDHGLEITDNMRDFKGLAEFTRERIPELIAQSEEEEKDELPEGCPPVEPVEDWNGALYALADELEDEWKRKKSTPEFKWAKNNRMNFFRWCSHHWTYENGRTFKGISLQQCLHSGRTRDKLEKPK